MGQRTKAQEKKVKHEQIIQCCVDASLGSGTASDLVNRSLNTYIFNPGATFPINEVHTNLY